MTKYEKHVMNCEAEEIYKYADRQYVSDMNYQRVNWERFRTCTAWTYENKDYVYLMSYNTIVAIYEKETHILADVLRLVYGYTATSASHISKFANYLRSQFGSVSVYRYN